jgi:hypothetical protein
MSDTHKIQDKMSVVYFKNSNVKSFKHLRVYVKYLKKFKKHANLTTISSTA